MALLDERTGWRTVGIVSGGHFFSHVYLLAFPPLFPFLQRQFDLTNAQLGLIVSMVMVGMLLQVPAGELVDRIGAKRVFVLGVAVTGGGVVLSGFAASYPMLLAFALVSGIGQSAFHPANYALLDAATPSDQEGKSFGIHTFSGYAGFAVVPILVGTLAVAYSWQLALVAVGGAGFVYALISLAALDPIYLDQAETIAEGDDEDGGHRSIRGSLSAFLSPVLLAVFVYFFVITLGNKGVQTFTPVLFVDSFDLSATIGNTALTGYFALAAIGVLVGGVVADRYEPHLVIIPALSMCGVVTWLAVSGLVPIVPIVGVSLFSVVGFFYGSALPSRDRLVNIVSTSGSVGRNFGFVFTGLSIGGLVSPVVLGTVIDFTTVTLAFVLIGVFFVTASMLGLAIGADRIPRSRATPQTSD